MAQAPRGQARRLLQGIETALVGGATRDRQELLPRPRRIGRRQLQPPAQPGESSRAVEADRRLPAQRHPGRARRRQFERAGETRRAREAVGGEHTVDPGRRGNGAAAAQLAGPGYPQPRSFERAVHHQAPAANLAGGREPVAPGERQFAGLDRDPGETVIARQPQRAAAGLAKHATGADVVVPGIPGIPAAARRVQRHPLIAEQLAWSTYRPGQVQQPQPKRASTPGSPRSTAVLNMVIRTCAMSM